MDLGSSSLSRNAKTFLSLAASSSSPGRTKVFPIQLRDIISPSCSGCGLSQNVSPKRYPALTGQMSEPWQLFLVLRGSSSTESLLSDSAPQPVSKGELRRPLRGICAAHLCIYSLPTLVKDYLWLTSNYFFLCFIVFLSVATSACPENVRKEKRIIVRDGGFVETLDLTKVLPIRLPACYRQTTLKKDLTGSSVNPCASVTQYLHSVY